MQSVIVSNRFILGIVAFSVSFGLSLVPKWDFSQAFLTGLITVVATYAAAIFVDKRRRNYELLLLGSLRKHIRDMEGLKSRLAREIEQIETHRSSLYTESKQLQNKITESRNQRDSLHREIGNFASQKKQIESEINNLETTIYSLEQHQLDLNNSLSTLTTEKRHIESSYHAAHHEITQLQTQISNIQQEKQELESSLTLLGRIKPQLEEKLYELRLEIQNLEIAKTEQNQIIIDTTNQQENLLANLTHLQTQKSAHQSELAQLQNEILLLQQERDILQNQVWEFLQQIEIFNQQPLSENTPAPEIELSPFADILENLNPVNHEINTGLPEEWHDFLNQLDNHEIQVLKAILEQNNPNPVIKKIAEANITMPNLLIDTLNERANNTLGELIIEPGVEAPKIYPEHLNNAKKIIYLYEHPLARQVSSN